MPLEADGFLTFIEKPQLREGELSHGERIETTCRDHQGRFIHAPQEVPQRSNVENSASSYMGLLDNFADSFADRCQKVLEQLESSLPQRKRRTVSVGKLCLNSLDLTKCNLFRPLALTAHQTEDSKEDSKEDEKGSRARSLAGDAKYPLCRWAPWNATPEQRAGALAMAAVALMPLSGGAMAGGSVAMAQCPAVCDFGYSFPSMKSLPPAKLAIPELSLEGYQKSILVLTFIQGSGGLARMCVGDVFGGAYTLLLATLGYNSRTPGPAANWLKTYVLITFINGTMSSVSLIQDVLVHNYPVIAPFKLPLATNLAHFVTLTVPGVSFLGAYFGWQYIKVQRKAVIEAQQRQLAMLMRMPPPPPLLPPLPAMQPHYSSSGMPMKVPLASVPEEQEEE